MTQSFDSASAPAITALQTRSPRSVFPRILLRFGGSALVLALLFHFLPLQQVWSTFGLLPATLWLAVLACYLLAHTVGVCKWRLMVNLAGAGLSFPQAARCYFAGLFSTLFLPSIVGGDLVRAGLGLRLGRSKAAVLLGSLVDRMVDVAALVILVAIGALLVPETLNPSSRRLFWILGTPVAGFATILAVLFIWLPAQRFPFWMRRQLVRVRNAWRSMSRQRYYVLLALSLGLLVQATFILLTARVAAVCNLHLPLRAWFFAYPLAKFSGLVPVTQGGIGVREAVLAGLLAPFGAPPAVTVAVGLAWEVIVISGGLLGGLSSFLLGLSSRRNQAGSP